MRKIFLLLSLLILQSCQEFMQAPQQGRRANIPTDENGNTGRYNYPRPTPAPTPTPVYDSKLTLYFNNIKFDSNQPIQFDVSNEDKTISFIIRNEGNISGYVFSNFYHPNVITNTNCYQLSQKQSCYIWLTFLKKENKIQTIQINPKYNLYPNYLEFQPTINISSIPVFNEPTVEPEENIVIIPAPIMPEVIEPQVPVLSPVIEEPEEPIMVSVPTPNPEPIPEVVYVPEPIPEPIPETVPAIPEIIVEPLPVVIDTPVQEELNEPEYEPLPPQVVDESPIQEESKTEEHNHTHEEEQVSPIIPQKHLVPIVSVPKITNLEEIKIISLYAYFAKKSGHSFDFSKLYFTFEQDKMLEDGTVIKANCSIAGKKYVAYATRDLALNEKVHICKETWDSVQYNNIYKEMILFHELSHIFLNLDHTDGKHTDGKYFSIMNSFLFGEKIYRANYQYYIEELFHYSFADNYEYNEFEYYIP